MRVQHLPVAKLAKDPSPFSRVTIIVSPSADFAKGKGLAILPASARERLQAATSRLKEPLKAGGRLRIPGLTAAEEDLWVALLPDKPEAYFLLEFARDTWKQALHPSNERARLVLAGPELAAETADAFGSALAARVFPMPVFGRREKDQKPWLLAELELVSASRRDVEAFEYGYAAGEGTNLARFLATLPPNILDTAGYGQRIRQIAKENGIGVRFHSNAELKKMGAGAFTAVDQGNPESAGGIYELSHEPKGAKPKRTIHLVGKGICFDTGGYDVKVGGNMLTMKGDMGGSAVALATLVTAARLKLPYRLKAFLAVTENHISPRAYRPDEVVTALNGLTIEVVNTDAEGRMVLADTLTLASRGKPDCVIDFATLTGSAVRAIGTRYSAGFTNRDDYHDRIKEAGRRSGERVWTFPIDSSFEKALESKVADTLQCVKGPGPDHILASCFLARFLEEGTPWVHIDLAASENEGGIGHVDSMFTGFGVRWALEFIRRLQEPSKPRPA